MLRALFGSMLLLAGASLAGCGDSPTDADQRSITVLAAASLTEAFQGMAGRFEAEHPGVTVRLAFDSSATLATQAVQGAPADVLATADTATMEQARAGGALQGTPQVFATNSATLVVPIANPAHLTRFADLQDGAVQYVVCVQTAPCGATAATLLHDNGVTHQPVSEEVDVKAALQKVITGQADAAIVYRTDAVAARSQVRAIDIPGAAALRQQYPIAVLHQAEQSTLAQQFVDLVLSSSGRTLLARDGFGRP